jgi:tryptophan synthase alpha chain
LSAEAGRGGEAGAQPGGAPQAGAGESRLTRAFRQAAHPLLIPFAVGGYPDRGTCARLLEAYAQAGAGIVEIGVPFSDPLADGPVIQAASQVALRAGTRPAHVLELAAQAAETGVAVVLMGYLNTILAYGVERFFADCGRKGVAGVVVPDVPVEEAADLQRMAGSNSVDVILLAAPTSSDARLARIAASASGFIYCVSTTGVTGARAALSATLPDFVARVRQQTDLPLAVGFGVSSAEQAASVARYADGVIIGSSLVDIVRRSDDPESAVAGVRSFLGEAVRAVAG